MERVTQTEYYVLIETEDIDFSMLRAAVKEKLMIYRVRIKNNMHGYQSNQVVEIEATSVEEALRIAQAKDIYADVNLVK